MNEWILIASCKQLVWCTRIGRNMPIWILCWILCLILGSGPGAALPLEVTGCGVGILFYTGLPGDPRSFYILSILLLLSYLSLPLGLSFFRLLKLSGWGRVFMGWVREVATQGVGWASEEASDLVAPPLNLVLYIHLRIFAYTSNALIASFEYMELMLASGTLKRFLLKSRLSTDRAPVTKLVCSTFQPCRCIAVLIALRRETWFSAVLLALTRYRSQQSDILLWSKIQKVPAVSPTGERTAIPSGRIRQKLSFTTVSLVIPSLIPVSSTGVRGRAISRARAAFHIVSCVRFRYWISLNSDVISSHIVWRHFSPETHKNIHSGAASRANSPRICRQHWWWASMCAADKVSQVCWIWPKVCSGSSFSVLNRPSAIQRALHRSHLSDSLSFVILWIHVFVGNVWEFACSILLWSCDLTEVIFIHSPSSSRPCPSRRN